MYSFFALIVFGLVLVYSIYRERRRRKPLLLIPGPPAESFYLGNLRQFYQGQAGEADFKWQEEYGDIVRIKGPFGENKILVSDPKATQHMYQTMGYNSLRQTSRRLVVRMTTGRGIIWADGETHMRHRKVMLPAFGAPETRALMPIFRHCAARITAKWKDTIAQSAAQSAVFNVPPWLTRATLDAIGEAAFDYEFGAMADLDNELAKSYDNLFHKMFGTPSTGAVFAQAVTQYFPFWLLELLVDYAPGAALEYVRANGRLAVKVAKELVKEKASAALQGKGDKDVMSILVRANQGMDPKGKLTDEELYDQMRTIILAGHETTSNTLSWALYELAMNPGIQNKMRSEIRAAESASRARGDMELNAKDLDAMPYVTAVMKEVLRLHPILYSLFRECNEDHVLPLSKPITLTNGKAVSEIFVPAGTKVITSIAGYNRVKSVWGEDAHVFRPDRWLDGTIATTETNVGVYGNLMTFSEGSRSCIGWRFAVLELQTFLVELVGNFVYELAVDPAKIKRESSVVMVPTIEGELEKGSQLPLKVSVVSC